MVSPQSRSRSITAIHSPTRSESTNMPYKPNYKHQRAERDRVKKASRDAKLQERKEQATLRKASESGDAETGDNLVEDSGE
jgi:hypothetical protein